MDLLFIMKESIKDTLKNIKLGSSSFPSTAESDQIHLKKTMAWLELSVKNGKGGSSSHYSLIKGKWLDPFPETTGYIIPTFFDYYKFTKDSKYFDIAVDLTNWLGKVQLDNGACMQGSYNEKKKDTNQIVFNTGQNILGFIRAYIETRNEKYLNNAIKAGDFLISSVDENNVWHKNLLRNIKHTINSRTSWSLLELNKLSPKSEYVKVAESNLDWTTKQQTPNGWFNYGTSRVGGYPNTHFLSYTCEGLIESYKINNNKDYFNIAYKTAEKMKQIFDKRRVLYCFWDEDWNHHGKYIKATRGRFICITGCVQISRVWMQIFLETMNRAFWDSACRMIEIMKDLQDIKSGKEGVEGGVKGSFPIYGSYSALKYPNWAAKFFADALLTKLRIKKQHGI